MTPEIRQRFTHLVTYLIVALISLSLFRIGLLSINFNRIEPGLVSDLLLFGVRFDLIVVGYFLVLPLFLATFTPARGASSLSLFLRIYYRSTYLIMMVMEAIGVGFLAEYDHRPDTLFWEYLSYQSEVSQMLMHGYAREIGGTVLVGAVAYLVGKRVFVKKNISLPRTSGLRSVAANLAVFSIGLIFLALSIRSSLGHRPANISTALFSDNRLANELSLNSTYTAGYAQYSRRHDSDNAKLYGKMDFQDAIDLVFNSLQPAVIASEDPKYPTVHRVHPNQLLERPRNVVIVLEESLGARFVGVLGGASLTPNFDRLSRSGVLFTNLYATGTRTARGIEAVLSGYPPSASQSIVKRSKSRRDFFTLAQMLKKHGYRSCFFYGGEPNFDEMGSFMLGNGFDAVIAGPAEHPDAEFVGSWGVSDEDWVRRAHQEFVKANEEGPFFGLMLSTSNHSPWEFPAGRINPGPGPLKSRENAIRYADYALGEFFTLARTAKYYDNTIFLVVADHDSRVYGEEFVPVDYFHIPGLLIGKDLTPSRYDRLASQIDLLPSILPLLGIPVDSPLLGQDLFTPDLKGPGRALMQYGMNNALMRGDDVIVRVPHKSVRQFKRRPNGLLPATVDPDLADLSLAYLTLANDLYEQKSYQVPGLETPRLTTVKTPHSVRVVD
jgi:phosphoglycerol transferase MdoB-like AlkP superfamily enzyme